jgi:hypothetical protein
MEENWYDNYVTSTQKQECLIKLNYTINEIIESNITDKIDILEKEYNKLFDDIEMYIKQYDNIETIQKLNSLEILVYEDNLIDFISKYLCKNNKIDKLFIINVLNLIYKMSTVLSNRLDLKPISHVKYLKSKKITRCSYKFCIYKDSCTYNYNKQTQACYSDHYVHDRVCGDIKSLINYVNHHYSQSVFVCSREILKCIHTLQYVIRHMKNELNTLCIYDKNIEHNHFIKNKKT